MLHACKHPVNREIQREFSQAGQLNQFIGQIPSTLESWENLPYLITFLITILLLVVPLPASP